MEPKFFDNRLNIVRDDLVKTIREGDWSANTYLDKS